MTVLIKSSRTAAGDDNVSNVSRLQQHLLSDENESVRILAGDIDMLKTFEDIAQLYGHKYALNHIVISPHANVQPDELNHIISEILNEYGADEYVLIEHVKEREDKTKFPHFHLITESTKDGCVLDVTHSYLRNEYLSRRAEIHLGMELGSGSHNTYVQKRLEAVGLGGENRVKPPIDKSQAYSQKQYQKAKRIGINLPSIAYEISQLGGGETLINGLIQIEEKFNVKFEKGDTRNVVLIRSNDGKDAGAVNKLLGITRAETEEFISKFEQAKFNKLSEVTDQSENRILVTDSSSVKEDRTADRTARPDPSGNPRRDEGTGRNSRTDLSEPRQFGQSNNSNRKQSIRTVGFTSKIRAILKNRAFRRGANRASGYSDMLRSVASAESPEFPSIDDNPWSFLKRWAAAYAKSQGFRM